MIDTGEVTLWPDSNYFLKLGLAAAPLCMHVDKKKEYIFIDFSKMNTSYFTNPRWLGLLKNTDKKLILICDSVMGPLAEFWKVHERRIYTVIYSSCELKDNVEILHLSHSCSCLTCKVEVKKLSAYEVLYMDLTFNGLSPLLISKALNIPIKKVYNTKRSINNKFRKDIKNVMFKQIQVSIKSE
ncbi:hypothetical protein [Rahnella aceris]|uniref:hypothetical protein n=1 Tax=Rahnella sp. (strain Y9602) TaxID=2703885 RepID=UPI000EB32AD5|nr:hypothetical protein BJ925_0037 [Rahnella aquatilis]